MSHQDQLTALDRGLLEMANEVAYLAGRNDNLRERIVDLAAEVAGLKVELQSGRPAAVPAQGDSASQAEPLHRVPATSQGRAALPDPARGASQRDRHGLVLVRSDADREAE